MTWRDAVAGGGQPLGERGEMLRWNSTVCRLPIAGDKPMDRFIDLPPWSHDMPAEWQAWHGEGAHLKVAIDGFASTCFGLIVRKSE